MQKESRVIIRTGVHSSCKGNTMTKERTYFQNLEEVPKLAENEPIFYHPEDCDCVKCLARLEKGGLDYDPSNDDEEFEEHERQVFRDKGITKKEDK